MDKGLPSVGLNAERPFSDAEWSVLKEHVTGSALRQLQLPAFTEGRVRARFRAGLHETLEQQRSQLRDLALWVQDTARRHPVLDGAGTLGLARRLVDMAEAQRQADRDRNPVIAHAGDLLEAQEAGRRADAVLARRKLRQALGSLASADFEEASLDLAAQEGPWPHWAFYLPLALGVAGVAEGHLQGAEDLERLPAAVAADLAELAKPISAVAAQFGILSPFCGALARAVGEQLPAELIRSLATRDMRPLPAATAPMRGGFGAASAAERRSHLRLV